MNPALYDQMTIDIQAGAYLFRAQGAVLKFPGFTIVYTEGKEDNGNGEENDLGKIMPPVSEGETLELVSLKPDQKFTQPPPRYSEASLVRKLEEEGIGRPSTYATILSTIQDRDYVRMEKAKLHPTDLGILITELLVKNFPSILDLSFTASMETKLDMIAAGKIKRSDTLKDFYAPFEKDLKKAKQDMRNVKREETPTDLVCEKCGNPMIIKWGRNGKFIACSHYPDCKNTANITQDEQGGIAPVAAEVTDTLCGKCGKNMVVKQGRFGRFLGCSGYPECKNTMPLSLGISCPEQGCDGFLSEKKTKKGKTFFSCSNYPQCTYAMWDRPVAEKCPRCGMPFLVEKYSRAKGAYKACSKKECGYKSGE
jgi:DNA topoisomerase-1